MSLSRKSALIPLIALIAGCGTLSTTSGSPPSPPSAALTVSTAPTAPSTCRARGAGLFALPDPSCTPGAMNPSVTQATVSRTICVRGWTKTVRPPASVTGPEKRVSMRQYGDVGSPSAFEYDHLIPLELGGATNDSRNLWPEPGYPNPKDKLENQLRALVCSGRLTLVAAQRQIVPDWVAAYHRTLG